MVRCDGELAHAGSLRHAERVRNLLRHPILAVCVLLTAVAGFAVLGVAVATLVANHQLFGIGIAVILALYGASLVAFAWFTAKGHSWSLGLIVASSLLHLMVVYSLLTSADRAQFVGTIIVAPFVLVTVVTSIWAVGRREVERLRSG